MLFTNDRFETITEVGKEMKGFLCTAILSMM